MTHYLPKFPIFHGSSFIWNGIWTAKEELKGNFIWVLGDGESIEAFKEPWLSKKRNFRVENLHTYEGREDRVSSLFQPGTKSWDIQKIWESFCTEDADAILAINVPQQIVGDRVAWHDSKDGSYNVKSGYRKWNEMHIEVATVAPSGGWTKLWRLRIPLKMKIFIWRLCRNNIPIRNRLKSKGVTCPIVCPMCHVDIEHLLHVFFDCNFATGCWRHVDLVYDMNNVESANSWLLNKLETTSQEEITSICTVLWGIWYWRNKRVWEEKVVGPQIAMEWSFNYLKEWRAARHKRDDNKMYKSDAGAQILQKWKPPDVGTLKLKVDASTNTTESSFSVGIVNRNHDGVFIEGRNKSWPYSADAFEAESIGVREALSWVIHRGDQQIIIETDSLLTVKAVNGEGDNMLEVSHIIEHCRSMLKSMTGVQVTHIRRQANRAAHTLAKILCISNCLNVFTSPPNLLLETILSFYLFICLRGEPFCIYKMLYG